MSWFLNGMAPAAADNHHPMIIFTLKHSSASATTFVWPIAPSFPTLTRPLQPQQQHAPALPILPRTLAAEPLLRPQTTLPITYPRTETSAVSPTQEQLHPTLLQNTDNRLHECDHCGTTFRSGRALRRHKTLSRRKPPSVDAQNPTTSTISSDNSTAQYRCDECGEVYRSGQALGGHKRKHYKGDLTRNGHDKKRAKACLNLDLNLPPASGV